MKITNNASIIYMIEDLQNTQAKDETSEEYVLEKVPFVIPAGVQQYFQGTMDSREKLAANKFFEKYIETNQIDIDYTETPENMDIFRHFLNSDRVTRKDPEAIIAIFKEAGLITQPIIEKVNKEKTIEHIHIRTEDTTLNIIEVEDTKLDRDQIQENLNFSELREVNIAGNKQRVEKLFDKINNQETERLDYYMQFAEITKGGTETIEADFNSLIERKRYLKELEGGLDAQARERIEHAKKIATITEKGIDYAISNLDWYGSRVNMKQTSEFSDVKRSVDNLLEIKKDDEEKDFVGIATDVTFRRIEDEEFTGKYFKLLDNIKDGYKTKVKYEKDSDGNIMKEFAVPKVLLHFEYKDLGMFTDILEKSTSESTEVLKEQYKDSPQKIKYLQQIVHQCKILSSFAKKHENSIFRRYDAIINSITELSWENPDIKLALETSQDNQVSQKLIQLTQEFEKIIERAA